MGYPEVPADGDRADAAIRVGILFVRSHDLVANAIGLALNLDPELRVVAIEVDSTTGPIHLVAAGADIAVVDDVSLVRQLHAKNRALCVIVLGLSSDPAIVLESIRAGAAACVGQPDSPNELAAIVKRVHAGEVVYELNDLLALLENPAVVPPPVPRRTARLSERELKVLEAVATGATSKEAAKILSISLNTLRTHLKNIQVKLEARSKLEAVLIAIREGRIALPPDED